MVTTVTDNSPQSINTSLFSLDKEVQEIKKVTDKLAGINTEYGVISVNGKQGIVELTASDVKALPDTTVIPTTTSELENTSGFITNSDSITGNAATATKAETATTADKAVEVVDYGDTSRTVRIGYFGPGVTADKLLYLAGYTERDSSSIKLKDVNKEELIKWLGIPRIKYADYQTPSQTFTQFQQVPIELSKFSSEVTPDNVLCFMVIYWSGVKLIASADWGSTGSSGLKCALIALEAGEGYAVIRCVYMV